MQSEQQRAPMAQDANRAMPQQQEPNGFEQRLLQLREESQQMEVKMRLNNGQNNYQMPI